jgi:hypothetical protein
VARPEAFVENPRRNARIPARLRVVVSHAGAGWSAETCDVSLHGCQIVTPRPMKVGEVARLVIDGPPGSPSLSVFGRVAWVVPGGRYRAGIAYAERQPDGDPVTWFRQVLAKQPGADGALRKHPDRLSTGTRIFLNPPPRFIFDFGSEEVAVIRAIGDGSTIENVLRGSTLDVGRVARAIFSLLEKRVVTLSLGEAAPAWKWKAALADFESQSGERRPAAPPGPRSPPPSPPAGIPPVRTTPAPAPVAPEPTEAAAPAQTPPPPAPRPAVARSAEAQECFDLAVSAVSMGEISTAIGLLRRALQMSPRDPEISALLGQLAFRDRQVGQ